MKSTFKTLAKEDQFTVGLYEPIEKVIEWTNDLNQHLADNPIGRVGMIHDQNDVIVVDIHTRNIEKMRWLLQKTTLRNYNHLVI